MTAIGTRPGRRQLLRLAFGAPLLASGCGWEPLYADRQTGPADAELSAIRVAPIRERIGQRLETLLRNALNPTGAPTPARYELRTTLAVTRSALGIQTQGLATRGKIDGYATFALVDIHSGKALLNSTTHSFDSFDIEPNGYATVVAADDARRRVATELSSEIVARLTVFLQRRAIGAATG